MSFDPSDLVGGYFDLLPIAEREGQECRERPEQPQDRQPPDVPDQPKAGNDGKERGDEPDGAVLRHFDWLVGARRCRLIRYFARVLLPAPVGVTRRNFG